MFVVQLNVIELQDRTSSLEQACHRVSSMEKTLVSFAHVQGKV